VISSFSKIFDNPDIMEELVPAWEEFPLAEIKSKKMDLDVDFVIDKTCNFIKRIYPILHSVEFSNMRVLGPTKSCDGFKANLA
jgi:hypothetical protein